MLVDISVKTTLGEPTAEFTEFINKKLQLKYIFFSFFYWLNY